MRDREGIRASRLERRDSFSQPFISTGILPQPLRQGAFNHLDDPIAQAFPPPLGPGAARLKIVRVAVERGNDACRRGA